MEDAIELVCGEEGGGSAAEEEGFKGRGEGRGGGRGMLARTGMRGEMADLLEEMIGVFGDHGGVFGEGAIADRGDGKVAVVAAASAKGDVDVGGLRHGELRMGRWELEYRVAEITQHQNTLAFCVAGYNVLKRVIVEFLRRPF